MFSFWATGDFPSSLIISEHSMDLVTPNPHCGGELPVWVQAATHTHTRARAGPGQGIVPRDVVYK